MAVISDELIAKTKNNMDALNEFTEQVTPGMVQDDEGRSFPNVSKVISDSARYKVAVAWAQNTQVTDTLQTYSYNNVVYAPTPNLVPFDTGSSFNASQFFIIASYSNLILEKTTDINLTNLTNVKKVSTKSYDGNGVGGAEWLETGVDTPAKAGTKDFANGKIYDVNGKEFFIKFNNSLNPDVFGAKCDGTTDDTIPIQQSIDVLRTKNGGNIELSSGTYVVSGVTGKNYSGYPVAITGDFCFLVWKNTVIRGKGFDTIIKRKTSEALTDTCIFHNGNAYYNNNYDADGNICFENLTIDGSDVSDSASIGANLIGFGNGDGLVLKNVKFTNHNWHALDFCRSRNLIVDGCCFDNDITTLNGNGTTLQIDRGITYLIDSDTNKYKDSYNVIVKNCKFSNINTVSNGHIHFHTGINARNILIENNTFDMINGTTNNYAIYADSDASYQELVIRNNRFAGYMNSQKFIYLQRNSSTNNDLISKNIIIEDNCFDGMFRYAIQVLNSYNDYLSLGYNKSVYIRRNKINVETAFIGANHYIGVRGFDEVEISGNSIKEYDTIDNNTAFTTVALKVLNCRNFNIKNNYLERKWSFSHTGSTTVRDIEIYVGDLLASLENGRAFTCDISQNTINSTYSQYAIRFDYSSLNSLTIPDLNIGVDTGKGTISRNYMNGSFVTHMRDSFGFSDGTNNLKYVDFVEAGISKTTTNSKVLNISSGQLISNVPLHGRIEGVATPGTARIEIEFSLNENYFDDETYPIVNGVNIGVYPRIINKLSGKFKIATGSAGVNKTISETTFNDAVFSSGFIRVKSGF